jgi:hypothetical protein
MEEVKVYGGIPKYILWKFSKEIKVKAFRGM